MITDVDIPTSDPGEVITQYTPLLHRIAQRYKNAIENQPAIDMDDLLQVGRIAIYNGQKDYNPDRGSFVSFVYKRILWAMYRASGYDSNTGKLPERLVSLDEPLTEDSDECRVDFVPDTALTAEERLVEQDNHQETTEAVRRAIERLKNARQREVITRCWLNGQEKTEAAAEMGIKITALRAIDLEGRHKLRRDAALKAYASLCFPTMHVGAGSFRSTWTSAVEKAVLWRERRFDDEFGEGAFTRFNVIQANNQHDPGSVQTSMAEAEA